MPVEKRDLAHYPFLPEAQGVLASRGIKVSGLSGSKIGCSYLDRAAERVITALDGKTIYPESEDDVVSDIITYVLARVLASASKDKRTMDRLCKMEAHRVVFYLNSEENVLLKKRVYEELEVMTGDGSLPVIRYVELASRVRDAKWRLINREVGNGRVSVSSGEMDILVEERIRTILSSGLPLGIPDSMAREYLPWSDKILAAMQERTLAEFGAIDESAYPPCIQALISAASAGVNLTHSGRFSMTAFLRSVGMNNEQIAGIFARSPDYNPDMTNYQVDHILTNEYTTPSCATMLTHGICVNKDRLCESVSHPLTYYRSKKKEFEWEKMRKADEEAMKKAKQASEENPDAGSPGP
ncbi:MAG: DNA primase regulatory subunit PriL [Methanocorpusculum sp.]|jgi:DNA primase large subunit|uniref:DNA primase regulatory subunit PriL n=1 Tax=Methanocorpusculum sp. TaxID=2058474 RepID=UPI002A53F917|nr:DNA primase regulatory subunit PriL [Methanocorpusculum sp.]MDD2248894.1 DNA primase regulatory subunit PriL [Methanocorpusculum sp.]MDD3047655.1 DNA primase regulatory subunit PriL [Methanocorpusculum sp.]MDD3912879.1 DNA primase regulatory subunit PriL [Methanocorpusculum sp.]MEA5086516.1 DNA primase regulatory subunit PriL [Methanocorpusculum sp.]